MCGICGFYGPNDKGLLKNMMDTIIHRGPDDSGTFIDNNISLGFRRLSIIDLSKKGNQPMANENSDIFIVFNGEIYNFIELRKWLEEKGHIFKSNTDTEVIVHLYEEKGEDCVKSLDGMFAFAIYDMKKKILFLARDRMGKKPVYYANTGERFFFASELKAILEYKDFKKAINMQSLYDYLSYRYVPEPNTILNGVFKLEAGSYLIYKQGNIVIKKYWDLEFNEEGIGLYPAAKKLKELLQDAVTKRLISDVPLGVYLSGGIDSSLIVSMMKRTIQEPKTFTIGYEVEGFEDELEKANKVAEYFGTRHKEIIVKIDPIKELPKIIWHMDEPIADPASIPVYYLSKEAKKFVTVVLVGEGSDETFAGYEQYKILSAFYRYKHLLPKSIKNGLIAPVFKRMPLRYLNHFFKYSSTLGEKGRDRFIQLIMKGGNLSQDYFDIQSIFSEDEKRMIYKEDTSKRPLKDSARLIKPYFEKKISMLNKMLLVDNKTFLLQLLLKGDKMTMAHSVEARMPFLDKDLIEFASRLPSEYKLKGFNEKYILKKAAKDLVPKEVVRRKKQRFFVPIHYWFKKDIKDHFFDTFSKERIRENKFFKYEYIDNIKEKYDKSPLYYSRQMWNLLIFDKWHERFIA